MSNHVMLEVVQKLIEGYESGELIHSVAFCPLCQKFLNEKGPQRKESCAQCPNIVFGISDYERPCLERGNKFLSLYYVRKENNKTLANYWRLVLTLLESKTSEELSEMGEKLQAEILKIAETFS